MLGLVRTIPVSLELVSANPMRLELVPDGTSARTDGLVTQIVGLVDQISQSNRHNDQLKSWSCYTSLPQCFDNLILFPSQKTIYAQIDVTFSFLHCFWGFRLFLLLLNIRDGLFRFINMLILPIIPTVLSSRYL